MKVAIILVNWKGWRDTIECLESIFNLDYPGFRVFVVDNDSGDGSPDRIKEWAAGSQPVPVATLTPLTPLTLPTVQKPVTVIECDRRQVENGAIADGPLVLIHAGGNLGFAGGNNIVLRHILNQGDYDYAWLLNNDTVIDPKALSALLQRSFEHPMAGIIGSTLLLYDQPKTVQAYGGARFNRWLAKASPIGLFSEWRILDAKAIAEVEHESAYVIGASMLVSSTFLRKVGLMDEDYFLYFEELDWARRGSACFKLAYAPDSIVYHKVGRSTGNQSLLSLHYLSRSRIRFMRKHYPRLLPATYLQMAWESFKALIKGRRNELKALLLAMRNPDQWPSQLPPNVTNRTGREFNI
ncbi:glycosyltransferase family 2 protein [Piscinibacter sakaiensis]|uniref:glycosyltransferase family 2 protein n=1 Tax=Piscinibacter sakaiensis TaxID=1547922 RepID=UPI003AAAA1CA